MMENEPEAWFILNPDDSKEYPLKIIRDNTPPYSGSHPQWLIPRGAHAEPGELIKKLWKRYYRPAKASDHTGLVIAGIVNESGWALEVGLPISEKYVASYGDGN